MQTEKKNIFLQKALEDIPKLFTLLDRNPHSPTYGCFDRNYWHYKIIDFPSGMAQEFIFPLALAYDTGSSGNPYYKKRVLKDWVRAAMAFAAKSAHKDGSCDDYYPFERASGAAAFSVLAFVESYKLMGFHDPELVAFFSKRADWLADHMESGQLSNHQALITLCLELLGRLLKTDRWSRQKNKRLELVLAWQNEEGWFQEYEGFDPGYHTLTVLLLAWLHQLDTGNQLLQRAVSKAVDLALECMHPDGTYGGEYGSRNTNNYFSYGFELAGRWKPEALYMNDRFSQALKSKQTPCYSDDHILGHHLWDHFLTFRGYNTTRNYQFTPKKRVFLKNAQLLIDRRQDTELYLALNKGGVFKLFKDNKLVCADTGLSIVMQQGKKTKNAVSHLIDDYEIETDGDTIIIRGQMGWAKQRQMTSSQMIILRVIMFTLGRFFPNLVRKGLQKLLITGKVRTSVRFKRRLTWNKTKWQVEDKLGSINWQQVKSVCLGCDQTSIYVVMSRTFHPGQLFPAIDLSGKLSKLGPGQDLVYKRDLP
ncbi:MAG: hypothetical protein GY874_13275 [Desulfobacteraceae bacterium]|nr:hypothetical protein [Desulfobacteraceae bacterium]